MKITDVTRVKFAVYALLLLVLLVSACKKDKARPDVEFNTLQGTWKDRESTPNFNKFLKVTQDSIFLMFKPIGNFNEESYFSGTYNIKGDSLKVNFNESVTKRDNKVISKIKIYGQVLDNATFKLNNNILALKYLSYPADAPVVARSTFEKVGY
ncbi:hypothetical protein ACFQ3S_09535 [Mucilaginibacter terrae]|uniref:hypothetical protein n=1 Tax=Mucilaginibacter terrae TaxID=1955052 RepID=UPI00363D9D00